VTCKPVTKNVVQHGKRVKVTQLQCSTKLVTGPVKFTTASASGRATLSRGGVVYATGYVYTRRGASHTSLLAARTLRRGRYTLTATRRSKGRSVLTRSQITIA
jgi:hypothetical protein